MTLAEMILAAHSSKDRVSPGEFIEASVDMVLANDITGPIAIREFNKIGVKEVFDKSKGVIVPDHFTPNKDIASAEQAKTVREFCRQQECHYYEVGRVGIEHVLLHEEGLVLPGDLIIGADSHTCTYGALGAFGTGMGSTDIATAMATGHIWMKVPPTIRFNYIGEPKRWVGGKDYILHTIGDIGVDGALYSAMEFGGGAIDNLSLEGRLTMANMAIEAGAKAGLFYADEKTVSYAKERTRRPFIVYEPMPDAEYADVITYDVSEIEPQVAFPHLPSNTRPVSKAGHVKIDQAVIGSCTNGRIEDLRVAATILKDRKVDSTVRCIIIPGSQSVYMQAIKEGLIEIFINAGCAVSAPTCGPCLGGHMGILAAGEKAIATTNRNFIGRMGSPKSEVYLSSPAVAAASAISGNIIGPEDL
jgi:3-isopropylmalate/(R)-2-methylmalate dehydratase large subunit